MCPQWAAVYTRHAAESGFAQSLAIFQRPRWTPPPHTHTQNSDDAPFCLPLATPGISISTCWGTTDRTVELVQNPWPVHWSAVVPAARAASAGRLCRVQPGTLFFLNVYVFDPSIRSFHKGHTPQDPVQSSAGQNCMPNFMIQWGGCQPTTNDTTPLMTELEGRQI